MKKRILGRTGLDISVIGFGGIPIQGVDYKEAERVILAALDGGVNFIDTARGYTDSEDKIGKALSAARRQQIVLASKAMSRDSKGMNEELEKSLKNLRTDTIDLYQLHAVGTQSQLDQVLGPNGAFEALSKARQRGAIRFIGVTGHSRSILEKAVATGLFDTVQHPFNPIETEWLGDVIPAARERNVGIIGMKPLAGGAFENIEQALLFNLHKGVDIVIPGMDSLEKVACNVAVGRNLRQLTDKDLSLLESEKENLKGDLCRRCAYCMPCPNGLNIPMLLLLLRYHERYGLRDWAHQRLGELEKHYEDCAKCGECVERCPYDLPVPELMESAAKKMC